MKKYVVVHPDVIDPNDPLGSQEPIDTDVRDLVNVDDDTDRFMANPEDFDTIGEIVSEDDFILLMSNYVDEQGVGSAEFAHRK